MALVLTLINIFYNFAIICVVIGVTSGLYRYRPCYYSYGKSWVILTWSILIQHVTHRSMLICSQYYISDYGATTWLCGKLGNTCILSYSHFLPTSINWLLEPRLHPRIHLYRQCRFITYAAQLCSICCTIMFHQLCYVGIHTEPWMEGSGQGIVGWH